ncbi:hypothetical protein F4806DRAFT_443908 [Annulohypoxylon nitens]|nr:hypothetical protein F4806DRAFT_443908 [Annulohypoxylon nitens]
MSIVYNQYPPGELYFAFGSNMRLQQMVERCPESSLYSIGKLRGYRWQINQRGVANIIKSTPEDIIEGILFYVTKKNIATLDRNEGVKSGFYSREYLEVEVEPLFFEPPPGTREDMAAAAQWLEQCGSEMLSQLALLSAPPDQLRSGSRQATPLSSTNFEESQSRSSNMVVEALVYLSYQYVEDGHIRPEYVERMKLAMDDAQLLGVSETYLDTCLKPLVFAKKPEVQEADGKQVEQREPQPRNQPETARRSDDNPNRQRGRKRDSKSHDGSAGKHRKHHDETSRAKGQRQGQSIESRQSIDGGQQRGTQVTSTHRRPRETTTDGRRDGRVHNSARNHGIRHHDQGSQQRGLGAISSTYRYIFG